MKLTIDMHQDMIGSSKEIGELVEKQMIAEIEGKKKSIFEVETNNHDMIFEQIMGLRN